MIKSTLRAICALAVIALLSCGLAAAQGRHLPSSSAAREWLGKCFLTLPPLSSETQVYQDEKSLDYAAEIFEQTNAWRDKKGFPPLKRDQHLDAVAQAHAVDMAAQGYFDHDSPQGMDVFDRIESAGCPNWRTGGENIAAGYKGPKSAVDSWMNSPGHKRNMLDKNYEYMGVGAYYAPGTEYGWYWVQVFVTYDGGPARAQWLEPGVDLEVLTAE